MSFEEKLEEKSALKKAQTQEPQLQEPQAVTFTNELGNTLDTQLRKRKGGLEPGQIIAEHYEIIESIGQGGMSIVYKARHLLMNRIVALKVLTASRAADTVSIKRFQQEAEAASRLQHPSIVRVDQFGFDDSTELPFLIMEYVDGPSVSDWLEKHGPMPQAMASDIAMQVADAIALAHDQGVIHRDLKPSNILLKKDGDKERALVVDFGIAKLAEKEDGKPNVTKTGEVFGSPDYMSPEQCLGTIVDKRSDVYSLGCVIYEMLAGNPPFRTESPLQTIMLQIGQHKIDFKNLAITPGLKSIIAKCLEKAPEMRFQSMRAVKEALKEDKRVQDSLTLRLQKFSARIKREPKMRVFALLSTLAFAGVVYAMGEYYRVWPHDPVVPPEQISNPVSWNAAGNELQLICQYKKAIKNYEQAIKLNPNFYEAYFNLAHCYFKIGDFNEAVRIQRAAYHLRPSEPDGLTNLGSYLFELGEFREAQGWLLASNKLILDKYPELDKMPTKAVSMLDSKEEQQKCRQSGLLLNNYSKLEPIAERLGEDRDAVRYCEKIITLSPDGPTAQQWQEYLSSLQKRADKSSHLIQP